MLQTENKSIKVLIITIMIPPRTVLTVITLPDKVLGNPHIFSVSATLQKWSEYWLSDPFNILGQERPQLI